MKRLFIVACSFLSIISLIHAETKQAPQKKIILTSFYPLYIATRNIANDVPGIVVKNMTGPQTGCLHDYQLKPKDVKTIGNAWIFIVNGAGLESFIAKTVKQQKNLHLIYASKDIELLKNLGGAEENPHVWVSISGAINQVKNICDGLVALDSLNANRYKANAARYIEKLESLRKKMSDSLKSKQSRKIITFHEAFPYFAKEFNLVVASVIEREPGSEPSAGELAQTITLIKNRHAEALFAEPQYSGRAAEVIAKETGLKVYILDPVTTGPDSADAYITIMEKNLSTLMEALP